VGAAVEHNTAAAVRNKRALPVVALGGEARQEVLEEANKVVRSLIRGWDWGKWTFDL
jgi:hypothetical protein